jgi:hypothetical protein
VAESIRKGATNWLWNPSKGMKRLRACDYRCRYRSPWLAGFVMPRNQCWGGQTM